MKSYQKVEVLEQQLEDLVRRNAGLIEKDLEYLDHQKKAATGRLDVLFVDSGRSLVVAELKIMQDDSMLIQAIDYYDYLATNIESFGRIYKGVDPKQKIRLFLIAPSFSQSLINRCKWIDIPISLFTFDCLRFEDENEIVLVFREQDIPGTPKIVDFKSINDHLAYITDDVVRRNAEAVLDEIKSWKPNNISMDAITDAISLKVNGRVFAYFYPDRKHYWLGTYENEVDWKDYPIKSENDLLNVKPLIKKTFERLSQ